MKSRYTPRAVADLIADYIRQSSPAAARRVRAEIQRTISLLERFPLAGRRTDVLSVRKIPVRRYPYIIYHVVNAELEEVVIITVQHGARRQPFDVK